MNAKALTNQRFTFLTNILFLIIILFTNKINAADYNVSVTLISGATEQVLPYHPVNLYEQLADNSTQRIKSFTSDNQGLIQLSLAGLEQDRRYFLKTKSPFDGRIKKSNLISSAGSSTFTVGNQLLNVTVSSGVDNTALANQPVIIYRLLADGSRKGFNTVSTDNNGLITLDLPGLGSETRYQLRTFPQHGSRAIYSGAISSTGNFSFKVANVRVKAVNGQNNSLIANHKIKVYKHNADNSITWFSSANTDPSGLADFQLPNIASDNHYIFKAVNLSDGRTWTSDSITSPGPSTFTIGNKLLNVTVTSGIDNAPLTNQSVTIYKLLTNGTRKGFNTLTTDNNGLLTLDLPGLGIDTNYQLRTSPKHGNRNIFSGAISSPGNFSFKVANVRIKAIDGQTNNIIPGYTINAYKHNTNGTDTWFTSAITDASGLADFQLSGLSNQHYTFKATSLSNGRNWTSNIINSAGESVFTIGNKLLNVTVSSGVDNTALANQPVIIYQLLADGSRKGFNTVSTDINGLITLDLPGLGSETRYQLRTLPQHGNRAIYSGAISSTGDFAFKVANIRVKALSGKNNSLITNHKIKVYKHNADNSITWFTNANTDSSGFADFQLPNLGFGQQYIFKASSLSDGRVWTSDLITSLGTSTFTIGNKLLNVAVISGVDNTPLANQPVNVYQLLTDGTRKGIRTITSDNNGLLTLDLPGLGDTSRYVLRTLPKHGARHIYSGIINTTGNYSFKVANIRVKAINGQTNSIIANHKITVYKNNSDGSKSWFAYTHTDSSGQADFLLPNLAIGQQYTFKASSLSDNRTWTSDLITSAGSSTFVIGNKLLNVAISSGIDNAPLANQSVTLYQLLTDGTRKWLRTLTSDNNGLLALDLPGLGSDTKYELRTLPKHGSRHVYSGEINNTGRFSFKAANVRVKAINGQNNTFIANYQINVYKQNTNDSVTWFSSTNTDASGYADFQLPNVTSGQTYLFKAASLSDGRTWTSQPINTAGNSTFVIGNKLLNVAVSSGIDNTPLANQPVAIYQLLIDGTRKGIQTTSTDNHGLLALDLPDLGNGTQYELRTTPKHGTHNIYSGPINTTGNFSFKVASVSVTAINGQTNTAIPNHRITAYKQASDGALTWFTSASTDSTGKVDLQLLNLPTQHYVFKAASLSDSHTWTSEVIKTAGTSNFIIGNKLLNVSLLNALDNTPLANIEITAYLHLSDGSLKWAQKKTTDSNGQLYFDLKGLGNGSHYTLSTRPYGVKIVSKDITETGDFKIQAGAVAVTLRKKSNGSLIQNHKLTLYEKVASGKIEWRASSITNQNGKVYFDPAGLGTGKTYLIIANNIFGNSKNYYSQWIVSKGQFDFIVSPDDPHKLDEEAPSFNHIHPSNHAVLADQGFELKMQITDNNTVKNVNIRIIDPIKGTTTAQATLHNKEWVYSVTADMISKNQTLTVEIDALDQVDNKSNISYQYSIIEDVEKPIVTITSHQEGDQIDEHGFFLTGTVTDNTGYVKLLATVIDPVKGNIINHKELEIGKNHHWAIVAKDLSRNQDVIVKIEATDSAGNINNQQLLLSVMTENSSMIQLINRITYGPTPELLKELRDFGAESFIHRQLHPELIDDSEFERQQLISLMVDETGTFRNLHNSQVARAVSSKRQLLEVMTQFWESHFNTDLAKVRTITHEEQENTLFRQHALGNFRDLLQISATSPAMLTYLDNKLNIKNGPNENYARELMELHTLGVDNSYSSKDIAEVARVFTGWRIKSGAFFFSSWHHDDEEKIVLGTIIPSGSGISGGELVLDLLAEHQATAHFICTKLLIHFVSDNPTTDSINKCATDFSTHSNKDNQIALVLEGIFKSTSFSNSLNFHNKVKTPLEFIIGLYRQFPISINHNQTRIYLSNMGMPLFYYPLPTGWPENATDLINSNQMIQRWLLTNKILFNTPSQWRNHLLDPADYLINKGIETTEGILGYLFEITLAHNYSELEWTEALSLLTNQQTEEFDIYSADAEMKIRSLIELMLQYPNYQLQ